MLRVVDEGNSGGPQQKMEPIRDFLCDYNSTTITAHKNSVQYGTEKRR